MNLEKLNKPTDINIKLGSFLETTCKDRWRQVLSEADKIKNKHLITLEPAISHEQTDEMQTRNLQLVVPQGIQTTYSTQQQNWLMSLDDFISEIKQIQGMR